jgi:signal transduction histidine kinase
MSVNEAISSMFGTGRLDATLTAGSEGAETATRAWWRFMARPIVLASGFALLALISTASMFFVVMTKSNSDLVAHTLQVEYRLVALQVLIREAESGTRGYVVSNHPDYLTDFHTADVAITPALENLKELTADNPVQQRALAVLAPLVGQRLDALRGGIRVHDQMGADAAIALLRQGRGRVSMQQINEIIAGMTAEENRLLVLRTEQASRSNLLLLSVNLAGIAMMIALGTISTLTVRRMGAEALRDSQQRGDELQAAVNELEAFSYSVSHDLRAPLRAVDAFSRILLKDHAAAFSAEARDYLLSVRDNAVQMGHLVDDLLAFSRLGRKQLDKMTVSTTELVEKVVEEVRKQDAERPLKLSIGQLPNLWGDPTLLKQVFFNLIDNAFKYTRARAEAEIEIGSYHEGGEQVFFVRDNGAGFDMKYVDKLFGVFQRLHRAEDFEGTGVGLAIVQRIVHRHGGRVWAEAAVDRGATFRFTLEGSQNA